jgi:hypothetical protein
MLNLLPKLSHGRWKAQPVLYHVIVGGSPVAASRPAGFLPAASRPPSPGSAIE